MLILDLICSPSLIGSLLGIPQAYPVVQYSAAPDRAVVEVYLTKEDQPGSYFKFPLAAQPAAESERLQLGGTAADGTTLSLDLTFCQGRCGILMPTEADPEHDRFARANLMVNGVTKAQRMECFVTVDGT